MLLTPFNMVDGIDGLLVGCYCDLCRYRNFAKIDSQHGQLTYVLYLLPRLFLIS
ncbi:hypothetical protein O9929_00980 [Vibrio lentus]|nr:hypothetical protein [Vibrio lentus]